jgi:putative ABC transport system permease protein
LRKTPPGLPDDFGLSTTDQIIKRLDSILSMVVLVSIALASLGLMVGGIGVMNIMLVSVTERTKEIGVRKAIGARKFDIVIQFLTEAVTLAGIGGVAGIVFAALVTMLVGKLVPALAAPMPGWAVAMGLMVSVGVGIFFGTWPAMKAANLDPVEALRYE